LDDPFSLQRFVEAQSRDYGTAIRELRAGAKRSHWMWFVFPQLRGLGRSSTAMFYGITSIAEARAYLAHPVLGPRLRECVQSLLDLSESNAAEILGEIDAMKLRSSMTLFQVAAPDETLFSRALERFYQGKPDAHTLELLK
jgi:uncharacterized protein (DUF1810 family)